MLSGESIEAEDHEPAAVTITRLICQLILALAVLVGATVVFLLHPEYAVSASLLIGVVVGSWFGLVRSPSKRRVVHHEPHQ